MSNYKALHHTCTMKCLTNIVWAVKTWSCYFVRHSGGVLLSFKREPDGSSSMWMLCCLSYKLFVDFIFGSVSVWSAGRTPVAGASAVTSFSTENNIPGVCSVV